ncbi:GH20708 [Drosophila grimshawi]|uniref:dolichol kinase n=1 Tax=Drosophila grimshawi TaxID=7222 RepID=B4J701_DROGR|nr:GH20708 [Drosophila grimshawi]
MRRANDDEPVASNGGWLCLLLPTALATSYLHTNKECSNLDAVHQLLIVAAFGMCLETLWFLLNSIVKDVPCIGLMKYLLKSVIITTIWFILLPKTSWISLIVVGFIVPHFYQHIYIRVLRGLPKTFTYGEAAILVQGLLLFVLNAICRLALELSSNPTTDFGQLNRIMQSALMLLLLVCTLLAVVPPLRQPLPCYVLLLLLVAAVTCAPVTQPLPLIALLQFLVSDQKRLFIIGFYLLLVALTCATVHWQLRSTQQATTRIRKIFHLLIVLVFVPGLVHQCALLYIATGISFAIFVVLELLRLLQMPPFAATLSQAFDSFRDAKDAGQLALTPFCLLIGCSLPIWLTPCPCGLITSGQNPQLLLLLSGILAVGVGDTAASVLGSKFGRNKWQNSARSVEGTLAFVASVLLCVLLLEVSGILAMSQAKWFATIFAALNASLVEAFTDQVDNLVLPLVFYIIVGLAS